MTESAETPLAIGQNSLDPLEAGTKRILDASLEIPSVSDYILSHFPDLITATEDHLSFKGGLLYLLGNVTRETDNRSIPLRNARAEAYKHLENPTNPTEHDRIVIQREIERKRITRELYDHRLIEVETAYGRLGGQVSILNPDAKGRPMFVIPGSSNDPESMESTLVSVALLTERPIIAIGHPEAPNGKPTQKYCKTIIEESKRAQASFRADPEHGVPPNYEPQAAFFDAMISNPLFDRFRNMDGTIDILTDSIGGPILAKLLSREKYQQTVYDAVFLNPAATATFALSKPEEWLTGIKTGLAPFRRLNRYPRYTFWNDPRKPRRSEDKRLKFETWNAIMQGSHYAIPEWSTIKTLHTSVVYSGGKDAATRSYVLFNDKDHAQNPSLNVLFDEHADHYTVLTHPDETIEKILLFQSQISQKNQSENAET